MGNFQTNADMAPRKMEPPHIEATSKINPNRVSPPQRKIPTIQVEFKAWAIT